jgi:hypothetical protein
MTIGTVSPNAWVATTSVLGHAYHSYVGRARSKAGGAKKEIAPWVNDELGGLMRDRSHRPNCRRPLAASAAKGKAAVWLGVVVARGMVGLIVCSK